MAWYDFFTDVGQSAGNFWDSFFGDDNQTWTEQDFEYGGDDTEAPPSFANMSEYEDDFFQSAYEVKQFEEEDDFLQAAFSGDLRDYTYNPEMADDSSFIEDLIEKAKSIGPLAKAAKGILEAGGIGGKRGSQAPSTSRRGSPTAPSAREQRMKEAGRIAGSLTAPSGRGTSAAQMFARQNKVDVSQILASLTDPKASGPNIKLIVGNKLNVSRTA